MYAPPAPSCPFYCRGLAARPTQRAARLSEVSSVVVYGLVREPQRRIVPQALECLGKLAPRHGRHHRWRGKPARIDLRKVLDLACEWGAWERGRVRLQ